MKNQIITKLICCLLLLAAFFIAACNYENQSLTPHQIRHTRRDVKRFTDSIAANVTAKGPIAWLNIFDNSPDFFMANNGQLVFHDHASAQKFIQDTLVKNLTKITLRWGHMRIDPLTTNIASICSEFHEDLTINAKQFAVNGYFTATAVLDNSAWKLRNAHWSVNSK